MPNWKKVIVSGSDAVLNSVTTPNGTLNNFSASYALTASYVLGGGGGIGGEGISKLHTQSVASTTWTFIHNLGSQYVTIDVYDSDNNIIIPQQINATDSNTIIITFSTPRTGHAVATLGGGLPALTSSYANYVLQVNSSGSAVSWQSVANVTASNAITASYALTASYAANATIDSSSLATTGSNTFVGNQIITGSLSITNDITGSLQGTSSWANNAITSSYALNTTSASYALNTTSASYSLVATSASYANNATSASYAFNSTSASNAATASSADSFNVRNSFTASGLRYPTVDDGPESFIQTDGAGNLSLQYVKTLYQNIRNSETSSIAKGTPLFVSGSTGDNANVFIADAANPNRMPATLIAGDTLAPNATGRGIILGHIQGVDTTGYPAGTEVYVGIGGGWTATRPTGSNAEVQPLGIVTREGNNGMGIVLTVPPNNLPNIQSGYTWIGNGNGYPAAVPTSSLFVTSASYASNTDKLGGKDSSTYATTGSNIFNGSQTVSGSLTVLNNLTVYGSSSFVYVTASQLAVSSSIISVNVFEPAQRFGGLQIYDSGSSSATASFLWDSERNHFIYQNISGSSYSGGMFLSGPRNTGSLGDEQGLANGRIAKSIGGDHLDNSIMSEANGNLIRISGSLEVTGSVLASSFTGPLSGTASYASQALTASYTLNATTSSYAISSSQTQNAVSSSYPVAAYNNIIYTPLGGVSPSTFDNNSSRTTLILGYQAALNTTNSFDGRESIYIGAYAGANSTGNRSATFVGEGAGLNSINNAYSVVVGAYAGSDSTNSNEGSTVIGTYAGDFNIDSSYSTIIGNSAGNYVKASERVTLIGDSSGGSLTSSSYAIAIGQSVANTLSNSPGVTIVGNYAGEYAQSGSYSIVIGNSSGRLRDAGYKNLGRNNIIIGTNIALPSGRNDSINIGGILFGSGSAYQNMNSNGQGYTGFGSSFTGSLGNGKIGINVVNPQYNLDVSGSGNFTNTLTVTGSLTISQSLFNNQNTDSLASGVQTISTNATSSFTSAFYNYTLSSGSNARAGQVIAVWNGSSIQFTDNSTLDIGSTSNVALTASLSGANVVLSTVLPSSGWTIKTLVNLL